LPAPLAGSLTIDHIVSDASQVVPSIILSVISAFLGVVQLLLMGTADLLEPAVKGVLALTETSKDTVRGQASWPN
jgi:hypothetical protein